jgi:hypothetical protein
MHIFPLSSWITILYMVCWGYSNIFGLYGRNVSLWSFFLYIDGREAHFLYLMIRDEGGARWRRELHTSCCGQWWPWVLHTSWSRSGVVWGVGRSFGHSIVFLTFIFIYLLCLFFLLSSFLVCHLFSFHIFFVHSIWFLLKSSRSGRIIVCNSKSAGRRAVCSMRGGLFRDSYADILYPSNEGNSLVFWWIAVTLLWPGRGDFSTSGLSTFKKIVLISAPDYKNWFRVIKD